MQKKLVALRGRLVDAQQKLITQAAMSGVLPTDSAIKKISEIENAIMAVEHMIEELVDSKSVAPKLESPAPASPKSTTAKSGGAKSGTAKSAAAKSA